MWDQFRLWEFLSHSAIQFKFTETENAMDRADVWIWSLGFRIEDVQYLICSCWPEEITHIKCWLLDEVQKQTDSKQVKTLFETIS